MKLRTGLAINPPVTACHGDQLVSGVAAAPERVSNDVDVPDGNWPLTIRLLHAVGPPVFSTRDVKVAVGAYAVMRTASSLITPPPPTKSLAALGRITSRM